jgi:hypothetical protein
MSAVGRKMMDFLFSLIGGIKLVSFIEVFLFLYYLANLCGIETSIFFASCKGVELLLSINICLISSCLVWYENILLAWLRINPFHFAFQIFYL